MPYTAAGRLRTDRPQSMHISRNHLGWAIGERQVTVPISMKLGGLAIESEGLCPSLVSEWLHCTPATTDMNIIIITRYSEHE